MTTPERLPQVRARQAMLIGGEWVAAISGATIESRNPATGELLATVPAADEHDVDRAVQAARTAYPEWRRRGPRDRARLLEQVAARLEAQGERLDERPARRPPPGR